MLTRSEEEIMYLLWDVGEPLTSSEIVKMSENRSWKKSYINLLVNSLLKKGMIKVVGVKQMTKNYARTFEPTMTRNAFSIKQITQKEGFTEDSIPALFSELIQNTSNKDILNELDVLLKNRIAEI